MDKKWPEIQHFHRLCQRGQAEKPGKAETLEFLVKTASVLALLGFRERTMMENGPPDKIETLSAVIRSVLCTEGVLRTAILPPTREHDGMRGFQTRQMQSLSLKTSPRAACAVLDDLLVVLNCPNLPFGHKFAYLIGTNGHFASTLTQCLVHEDMDVSEKVAAVIRAAASKESESTSNENNAMLFEAFIAAVMYSLGGEGVLKVAPAHGNAMLQLRCVALGCTLGASSAPLLAHVRNVPKKKFEPTGYLLLLLRVEDFLIQMNTLELIGELIRLPCGADLLGLRVESAVLSDTQAESENGAEASSETDASSCAALWGHILELASGFYVRGEEAKDESGSERAFVPTAVRAAACRAYGFYLDPTATDQASHRSVAFFANVVLGSGARDPNNSSAFDVSSHACNEDAVCSFFGAMSNFATLYGSSAVHHLIQAVQSEKAVGLAPARAQASSVVATWAECVCADQASLRLQAIAVQALESCFVASAADATSSSAEVVISFVDTFFAPANGRGLVDQLMRQLKGEPEEEFRCTILQFLRSTCLLSQSSWGVRQLLASSEVLDYFTDPQSESSKGGRDTKFAVIDALINHPAVSRKATEGGETSVLGGHPVLAKLKRVHSAGPYPRFSTEAAVATMSGR